MSKKVKNPFFNFVKDKLMSIIYNIRIIRHFIIQTVYDSEYIVCLNFLIGWKNIRISKAYFFNNKFKTAK